MIDDIEIRTEHVRPPIPVRHYDWHAWVDGEEEDGIYGTGPTEAAAIEDLKLNWEPCFQPVQEKSDG